MKKRKARVIGIIGGMGPHAGLAVFNHILNQTNVQKDQDHLSVVLMSFPEQIMDRSEFLFGKAGINPAESILDIVQKLSDSGASVIGMACNTAHASRIYNVIMEVLPQINPSLHLVHMPYETCLYIKEQLPGARRVGVLSTNGTYKAGIYRRQLQALGLEPILPDANFQSTVIHRMIYDPVFGIKAHPENIRPEVYELWNQAFEFFRQQQTDAVVLGCTELGLVIKGDQIGPIKIVDSTKLLATALIREARQPVQQELLETVQFLL
ncbi:MAG: amino acid racemase [Bacteroidota bacterium]